MYWMTAAQLRLSTIDTEENWMGPDKEAIQCSILSQRGKTLPYSKERERRDHRKKLIIWRGPKISQLERFFVHC